MASRGRWPACGQAAIGAGEVAVNGYFTANSAILTPVRRFAGYLRANAASIPNYGERYRAGEVISSSLAESTIKRVVSKWMVKQGPGKVISRS